MTTNASPDRIGVRICRLAHGGDDLPLPDYATPGSSGMDVRAAVTEPVTLAPGATVLVPTGFTIEVPPGYEAQVRPRSGLAVKHGIGILNTPGTIDSDYRGEVKIILTNFGSEAFIIRRGERIAQLVVAPVVRVVWEEVSSVTPTGRGSGGFGHTGR